MRFPWQRRADEAREHRIDAEQRLTNAVNDWPEVRRHAYALRHQRELNGWTGTIKSIFDSGKREDQ